MKPRNIFNLNVDLNEDTSLTHLLDRYDTENNEKIDTQIIKYSLFMAKQNLQIS